MNLKKIFSDFASWIFVGLTFLGLIIIYAGIGEISSFNLFENTNWYFVGVGLVLILPCAFYVIRTKLFLNKVTDENIDRIHKLIKTGDKLIIDLDTLEIQTNSYKQEISIGSGYQQRNEYVDVNHNVIILEVPYQNELIKYELNINMELTKLRMHFAVKGETELYVDSQNPNNSYLDLTFLES
jgi:hypothetical protein